jgi:hypothetical protein
MWLASSASERCGNPANSSATTFVCANSLAYAFTHRIGCAALLGMAVNVYALAFGGYYLHINKIAAIGC